MTIVTVTPETSTPLGDIIKDTISKGKQALVFVNTKRSAEKTAEELAKLYKSTKLLQLSEQCGKALSSPTSQCKRLSRCVQHGIAFHHAGLASKQRDLIEQAFRDRTLKVICCTPTLAYGVDMPAYRAIIRDLKRFGGRGMQWIPTLDYLQMAGRAGRPNFDNAGQAIILASSPQEKTEAEQRYIYGEPEEIYSKLAVEPALRMYVLSLISAGFVKTEEELFDFFAKTFYAHQYKDIAQLQATLRRMVGKLEEWEFIRLPSAANDFTSADELSNASYKPTAVGRRVAELYIDPLTAHGFIASLQQASAKTLPSFSFVHLISSTQEMRPLLRVKTKEYDSVQQELLKHEPHLLISEPSLYDPSYEEFLDGVKTALMFFDWMEEKTEEHLLETYSIRPGELHAKRDIADWLLFACVELSKLLSFKPLVISLERTRVRLQAGVREELLPLLKFKGIGRVRARRLFTNKIVSSKEVRSASITTLAQIVGAQVAKSLKEQVGETVKEIPKLTRKGQLGLSKFT